MTFLQSIILGFVQGITEFLPISSSAHLVLVPYILGWQLQPEIVFPFDVLVQLGTLLAVIIYFAKDIANIIQSFFRCLRKKTPFSEPESRLGWLILLATIPAGVFGLLLKSEVEYAFSNPVATAVFLIITGALLIIAEKLGKNTKNLSDTNVPDAIWIGIGQACAIFPGISRSGATIAVGMLRNLKREDAARFSFLMSIPVMLAAGLLGILELSTLQNLSGSISLVIIGTAIAAITGYFSIHFLLQFLKRSKLTWFAYYCFTIAAITFLIHAIR
ncbi:MAG: undecaprenyl-diphosphatase UppP [Anaerolineae bacterium]|nr:undecaprenyl-diphosphatase UppP [Anaerolineae bacterium]